MHRKIFLALALQVLASVALAQTPVEPAKRLWLVVPWPAGGPVDGSARIIGERLGSELGKTTLVDNKPGGSGNIGAALVAKAAPDGNTLLYTTSALLMNAALRSNTGPKMTEGLVPVARIGNTPSVLVASSASGFTSLADLLKAARAKPGVVTFASGGNGSPGHFSGELLAYKTKTKLLHVPYKGGPPALNDMLAGLVDVYFAPASVVAAHVKAGKLQALAVTSDKRLADFPNAPTMAEAGVSDFKINQWMGIFAPKGTPAPVLDKLAITLRAILQKPDTRAALAKQGIDFNSEVSQAKFAEEVVEDSRHWNDLAAAADIRGE
jgi:tripartite-type tricarboxylate transporter receptor subunit TctC